MKYHALTVLLGVATWVLPVHARAQLAVVSRSVEERDVRSGEEYRGQIVVHNSTAEPQEAKVYQTDYHFLADGATYYDDPGTLPRSNAPWIAFAPSRLVVAPGREAVITYTVRVPRMGVAGPLAGTYWSIVMVEAVSKGSAESSVQALAKGKAQMGIQSVVRYAVQLATHVAGTGLYMAKFSEPRATTGKDPAKTTFTFILENTGERAYRPELRVELYDERGAPAGTFTQTRGLLYPGTAVRQEFELGPIRPGTYKVLVLADTGAEDVFGAQYTVKF